MGMFDKNGDEFISIGDELPFMIIEIDKHCMTFGKPERVYSLAMHQMSEYDLNGDEKLDREEFGPFFVECIVKNGFVNFKDFDWEEFEREHGTMSMNYH